MAPVVDVAALIAVRRSGPGPMSLGPRSTHCGQLLFAAL